MQVQNGLTATVVDSNGKKQVVTGTTPNFDALVLNMDGKLSVEYAKARTAINTDFKLNFPRNQALAKRLRKQSKTVVIEVLSGKVSKSKDETTGNDKLLVTFPDHTVARL